MRETFLVATVGDSILWLLFHNGRDWKNDILKIPKFNKQLLLRIKKTKTKTNI